MTEALYAALRAGSIDSNRMIEANQRLVGWKLSRPTAARPSVAPR